MKKNLFLCLFALLGFLSAAAQTTGNKGFKLNVNSGDAYLDCGDITQLNKAGVKEHRKLLFSMDSVKTCLEPLRQKSLLIILIKSETSSAFAEKKPIFASFVPAVPERVEPLPGDFASGLCRRIAAGQRSAPYCFGLSSLFGFFEHTGKLFQCDGFQKYGGKILLREVIGCLDICCDCYDFQVCRTGGGDSCPPGVGTPENHSSHSRCRGSQ